MRKARESKGLSLDDVAKETRVVKRYLQALESESLGTLPGGAYNRGYLRSYAAFLSLDPDELIRRYEEEEASQAEAGRLSTRPDAAETIRQAAARRNPAGSIVSHVLRSATANLGRVAATVGVVVLSGALGWFAAVWFRVPERPPALDDGGAIAPPASPAKAPGVAPAPGSASPPLLNADPSRKPAEESSGLGPEVLGAAPAGPRPAPERDAGRDTPEAFAGEDEAVELRSEETTVPLDQASAADAVAAPAEPSRDAGLTVPQSGVGTDVVNRELVGQAETFSVGTTVVFWTWVIGGEPGDSVRHVWLHNGQLSGMVELPVGGPSWRTQSRRALARGAEGTWVVEARDVEGRVLARHEFQCEL